MPVRTIEQALISQALTDKFIKMRCREKLASEFNFMRNQSAGNAATFMDFVQCVMFGAMLATQFKNYRVCRFEYQIQTVIDILKATQEGSDPSTGRLKEILETSHPLGRFDEPVMKAIASFDSTPEGASARAPY
jgi:hypothetical protein